MKRLHAKLGDDAAEPAYIQNEHGVGYRMPAPGAPAGALRFGPQRPRPATALRMKAEQAAARSRRTPACGERRRGRHSPQVARVAALLPSTRARPGGRDDSPTSTLESNVRRVTVHPFIGSVPVSNRDGSSRAAGVPSVPVPDWGRSEGQVRTRRLYNGPACTHVVEGQESKPRTRRRCQYPRSGLFA